MNHNTRAKQSQDSNLNASIPPNPDPLNHSDQAFSAFLQNLTRLAPPKKPAKPLEVVSRAPTLPEGWESLQADYERLHQAHTQFLFRYGVRLPRPGTQKLLSLIFLHRHMGGLVSLENLRAFVQQFAPQGSKDKQPRHLKYDGWHIVLGGKSRGTLPESAVYQDRTGVMQMAPSGSSVPDGHLMLASDKTPSPDFVLGKRSGGIDRANWHTLCASYDHRCAVCGQARHLEKGHKDPSKGMTLDNLLPMCGECNNFASDDLVFDDQGRIAALASERFVQTASLATRMRIFDALRKDRSVNINRI